MAGCGSTASWASAARSGSPSPLDRALPDGDLARAPEELRLPTVVVIDDDRPSTDLLTVYLESAGFEVSSAQDGPSGLEATRRMNPVAVVLDILLPLVNGWDVLRPQA